MTDCIDTYARCRDDVALTGLWSGALLLVVWRCPGVPEADAGWFLLGGLLLPALSVWWGQAPLRHRLVRGGLAGAGWLWGYRAYVGHQDHPWGAGPETNTCDGPCFGWYTFEFRPPLELLAAVVIVSAVAAGLGLVVGRLREGAHDAAEDALG